MRGVCAWAVVAIIVCGACLVGCKGVGKGKAVDKKTGEDLTKPLVMGKGMDVSKSPDTSRKGG
jgi:hypothetical protein